MKFDVYFERDTRVDNYQVGSRKELYKVKKEAHDYAVSCLPWDRINKSIKHLIYYYEMPVSEDMKRYTGIEEEVKAFRNPRGLTDIEFEDFLEAYHPLYVGAIHRHE